MKSGKDFTFKHYILERKRFKRNHRKKFLLVYVNLLTVFKSQESMKYTWLYYDIF